MMLEEVEASHILVETEEEALEIIDELDDGADFAELAKEYSIDPGTAEDGGDVGFFSLGQLVGEFTEAAYSMEIDEVSEPVESDYGYHIIKVTDRRDVDDVGSLEDNYDFILQTLIETRMTQDEANDKLNKLIEDADIEVKIDQFENLLDPEEEDIDLDDIDDITDDIDENDSEGNNANNNND